MVIILKDKADEKQVQQLTSWLKSMDLDIHVSKGSRHTLLGLVGDTSNVDIDLLKSLDVVDTVKRIQEPYKNANRKFHEDDTIVDVGGVKIGGGNFQIIAGPCSVESREQIIAVAQRREGLRRDAAARRRVQAAHLALCLPGTARRRHRAFEGSAARRRGCRS